MEITQEQINAAYEVAKLVYAGSLTSASGARRLRDESKFNEGTALLYISVFKKFVQGAEHKRSLSVNATRVYFQRILEDFGIDVLQRAIGTTRRHLDYLAEIEETKAPQLRALVEEFEKKLTQDALTRWSREIDEAVRRSLAESAETRRRRLSQAPEIPTRVRLETWQFLRNPDVIAEVLIRAKGRCERCKSAAPFERRSDGSPYLEVHHAIQLADGGPDTVENAVALCPNCHRRAHFGPLNSRVDR